MVITPSMVAAYNEAKAEKIAAEERFAKIESDLCQAMLVDEIKSGLVSVSGDVFKVTVVAKETTRIDDNGLRKLMGAVAFRKVCKPPKADGKLLEKAIKDGLVTADAVSPFVSFTENKPYVLVSRYKEDE